MKKRYFRFNVDQGLQNIGLDEYKKMEAIQVATEEYLTRMAQEFRVQDCMQNLILKQSGSRPTVDISTKTPHERTGKIEDLEEAIRVARQAVEITPEDHPDLAGRLNNLGTKLSRRYDRTRKMDDLEEAIQVARQAVKVTPEEHPDLAAWLNNLGTKLESRYKCTRKMEDLEEAIRAGRQAAELLLAVDISALPPSYLHTHVK